MRAPPGLLDLVAAGRLQGERLARLPPAFRDALELCALRQPAEPRPGEPPCVQIQGFGLHRRRRMGGRKGQRGRREQAGPSGSGGELLAAAGAARVQDLAAADRRHPRAEAMAALADELAGLIGSLHGQVSKIVRARERARPVLDTAVLTNRATSRGKTLRRFRAAGMRGLCREGRGESIAFGSAGIGWQGARLVQLTQLQGRRHDGAASRPTAGDDARSPSRSIGEPMSLVED